MGVLVFETLLSLKKHEPKQCAGTRSCFKKVSYSATLITKKRYRVNGTGERGPGGQSFGQVWRVLGQVVLALSMRTPAVFTFRHTGFQLALTRFTSNAPIQLCSRVWGGSGISGGRSVARILVADDNSNIQKMVGLALKDQGIDVIAVGNGEAAVRKIADLRPDLVLADVFMPVRNGYEVCKFVKDDSSLAHIPVILLVGAFYPLDEQEAQRVGADGGLRNRTTRSMRRRRIRNLRTVIGVRKNRMLRKRKKSRQALRGGETAAVTI